MAESPSRTTLNLSKLSDRIERLRSDSAWKKLKLAQKVTLILEEYIEQAESGQALSLKRELDTQDDSEQDFFTINIDSDLKKRLEAVCTERGESLSSFLGWVSTLGLDLLDISSRLQIIPPASGDIQKWRIEISNIEVSPEESVSSPSESLIKYLSSLEKRPSNAEIKKMAARLQVRADELTQICDRLFASGEQLFRLEKGS